MSKSQEIEIKIQITEKQLFLLKTFLEKNGKKEKEKHQIDYYFDHPGHSFLGTREEGIKDAWEYLRIRTQDNGKNEICFKHWHPDKPGSNSASHCDEFETKIGDVEQMRNILTALGYEKSVIVDKHRQTYTYNGFEVEIDDVKDCGIFVEIEIEEEMENPKEGKAQIYEFLKKVGITKFTIQDRGYVSMLWNPGHDFGIKKDLN